MWFEELMGFREETPHQVRSNIVVDGKTMTSKAKDQVYRCGWVETPTLAELRSRVEKKLSSANGGQLRLSEIVANVQHLHQDAENANALFQVASQFNLLEMVSPEITPERGVDIYENDRTQGPACAIAAGAGTIYRNYFVRVNGRIGQSADNQIDCLADLGGALGNQDGQLWTMRNGYALASRKGLQQISSHLAQVGANERDALRAKLRIGLHWGTQVTLGGASHSIQQAYCSALPVAYSEHSADDWEDFARLILEASYEATICTGILNGANSGNKSVFLTLLGGGAFGNRSDWIFSALERAITKYVSVGLDVAIVSYGSSNPAVRNFVEHRQ